MRPITRNIASKHFLNLSSTLFQTRTSLRTTHLLPSVRCHTSTASKTSRNASLSQARAKARYEHVYTAFHEKNGYTSPTFKPFLADMARRAGYTVSEGDDVADCRGDWSEKKLVSKGRAGNGKTISKEEDEREMESEEDGKVADDGDEVVTTNRLDEQYLEHLEKNAVDLLEHMRLLKGGKKEEESKTNRWEKKKAADVLEHVWMLQGGKKVCDKKHVEFIWWDPDKNEIMETSISW